MNRKLFSKIFVLWRKIHSYHLSIFDKKGAALVTSILFATVIAVGALVATQFTVQDIKLGERYTQTREAFYIAEAGIQKAMNYLNYDENGDSPGDAGEGFTEVLTNFESDHSAVFNDFEFGGGNYTVTVKDNDDNDDDKTTDVDNTIILNSTGIKDGRSITIEAVIQNGIYRNKHAITAGGDFTIEGDPTVQGSLGSIHSNADVVGVSTNVEQGIFAAGECDQGCQSGAISEEIPLANPGDFSDFASYILTDDGNITDPEGSSINIQENELENWSHVSTGSFTGWELEGCSGHGMFYSETSVRLTGDVGKCVTSEDDLQESVDLLEQYGTAVEAAKHCDLSPSTIRGRATAGQLRGLRPGDERGGQAVIPDMSGAAITGSDSVVCDGLPTKRQETNCLRDVLDDSPYAVAKKQGRQRGNYGCGNSDRATHTGCLRDILHQMGPGGPGCDPGLACDPASGTCCGQCDPGPACVADDPNAIPCCGGPGGQMAGGQMGPGGMRPQGDSGPCPPPLDLTLVAEGDIIISANADILNFKNPDHPEEVQNLLFVAGGDVDFGGSLTDAIDGIVIAGEQVSMTANANLSGYVIASDVFEESSTVTESKILENFTVTYNDLKNPFLNDQTKILSWKQ
jgi:hypothetical protein